jgi:hypothetical protein
MIKNFITAFVKAQKLMENPLKDSENPFHKSKYADLSAVRNACVAALNDNGIAVLQPIVQVEGKNYVKTLLVHESGESMECLTEIIYSKPNDAQAQGSGITYARRYGLQSLVCIAAEDDDGNEAVDKKVKESQYISDNQGKEIMDLAKKAGLDNILKLYRIEKITDLPVSKYQATIKGLKEKIARNEATKLVKANELTEEEKLERKAQEFKLAKEGE